MIDRFFGDADDFALIKEMWISPKMQKLLDRRNKRKQKLLDRRNKRKQKLVLRQNANGDKLK